MSPRRNGSGTFFVAVCRPPRRIECIRMSHKGSEGTETCPRNEPPRGGWQEQTQTGCVCVGGVPPGPLLPERGVWTAVGPRPETNTVLTRCLTSTHTRTQLCWEDLRGPRAPTVPSQSQGSRPSPREQDRRARQTGEPPGRGAGGAEEHAGARRLGPTRPGEHVNRRPAAGHHCGDRAGRALRPGDPQHLRRERLHFRNVSEIST